MKYFHKTNDLNFYLGPSPFDKYTPKEILQYAIGANMYVPAIHQDIYEKLINDKFYNIGALTLCLEDSIEESQVEEAELNIINLLDKIYKYTNTNKNKIHNIPLLFIRVRNIEQFRTFAQKLNKIQLTVICGFIFPKFNSFNGSNYFAILDDLSTKYNEILFGLPIIEDKNVMYKELRLAELSKIKNILHKYDKYVLNIRIGATDFSSIFGLRRDVYTTIYDIKVVADCLSDIINFFMRNDCEYVLSGPVWEYYSWNEESIEMINFKNELRLDIQNGFHGKTIIHPSQIEIVNKAYIVKYDEYQDAINIINSNGGVFASFKENRMNEVNPHRKWAKMILAKAKIFGVSNINSII